MEGYIYKISYKIDNRTYIGQTKHDVDGRIWEHFYKKIKHLTPFDKFCHTHSIDDFNIEIIETLTATTQKELKTLLNDREIYWINKLNTFSPDLSTGFNKTIGGGGNSGLKGENHFNYGRKFPDSVNKLKGKKGEEHFWYGKHLPEEMRLRISASHKRIPKEQHGRFGKKLSEESKEKIRQKALNRPKRKRVYNEDGTYKYIDLI